MISTAQSWRLLLLLLSFFLFHLSCAIDTLSSGQSLTSNQTLVSRNGTFALGFFSPGTSPYSYLAIWYNRISTQNKTSVWVANRNAPLRDASSSRFTLTPDGNLVVTNALGTPVWVADLTLRVTRNTTEAVLGDDGNLILRNGASPDDVYWQSFDHPGNTWLPGGRLRYDNIARRPLLLTSWKNDNDPAEGLFSLELVPTTAEYIIRWDQNVQYWSSGPWNGQIFRDIPEMSSNYYYNFTYITRPTESYFTYNIYDRTIITLRFVMALSGQIQVSSWNAYTQQWFLFWSQPREQCDVYAYCGTFGVCNQNQQPYCQCPADSFQPRSPTDWNMLDFSTGGCARRTPLQCGDRVGFSQVSNVNLPVNPQTLTAGSARECESACLNNCNCSAYAYGNRCSVWNGDLLGLQLSDANETGSDLYLRVAVDVQTPGGNAQRKKSSKNIEVIVVPTIIGALVLSVVTIFCCLRRKKGFEIVNVNKDLDEISNVESLQFNLATIIAATNNFSETNRLGKGGFGVVYKGKLSDGKQIAVKRLSRHSSQGAEEFKNEVLLLVRLQHRNLVRLLGFCLEGTEKILIYEFVPNSSLDKFIFDRVKRTSLDWDTRYKIIEGIARGLLYIHEDSRDRIIHRDLKASNILLDAQLNPKISDFGMARLFEVDQTQGSTNRVVGTYGYMSPEYAMHGCFSVKSDVFSFGVLVLEIITGKKNSNFFDPNHTEYLLSYAWRQWQDGTSLELLDPVCKERYSRDEVMRCIQMGLLCVQEDPARRPTMATVAVTLSNYSVILPLPSTPAFFLKYGSDMMSEEIGTTDSNRQTPCSVNEATVTELYPR